MKFIDRTREHEDNHIRHIDLQVLDVLLRIEEVLSEQTKMMQGLAQHLRAKTVDVVTLPPTFEKSAEYNPAPGGVTVVTKRRK